MTDEQTAFNLLHEPPTWATERPPSLAAGAAQVAESAKPLPNFAPQSPQNADPPALRPVALSAPFPLRRFFSNENWIDIGELARRKVLAAEEKSRPVETTGDEYDY
jgi:hypothetical protein